MAGLLALGGAMPNFSVLFSAGGNGKVLGRLSAFRGGMEPDKTLLFGFRPPSLPLIRACSLPASVVGPVDLPPWSLHLPLWAVSRRLQGVPALVLAPHGVHGVHGLGFMALMGVNFCQLFGAGC